RRGLFSHLRPHGLSDHGVGEGGRWRQGRVQMRLPQFGIRPQEKRTSHLWTGAPESAGASIGGRRRATDGGSNIRWKGRCTAGQVTAGRRRSTTMTKQNSWGGKKRGG